MAGTLPPIFIISEEDHGGYTAVALYTFLALMIVTVVARLFTRWYIGRKIYPDDIWLGAAAILGIIQSILVGLAIHYGLGRKIRTISPAHLNLYYQYVYVAQIFLIAAVACSKASIALLFNNLMKEGWTLRANQATMTVIAGWAISSIVALAFQCSMPAPWRTSGHCLDRPAFYQAIGVVNILTDICLIALPCNLLRKVQLSRWKRSRMMLLLATRIFVCMATCFQIYYATRYAGSRDSTWANINSTVWDQAMMNLSITTTAIPSLGRLVLELQPSVKAFTINDQPDTGRVDFYNVSSTGTRFGRDKKAEDILSVAQTSAHVSVGWRGSRIDDSESTQGLVTDANAQNVIQQTIHFEIH